MSLAHFKTPIQHITSNSRTVQAGSLFLAYPGEVADGRNYIADAIKNGASAVLWESENFAWNTNWQVENKAVSQLRLQASHIASAFYRMPSQQLWMIGVTGTNGKTSITHWLSQCFNYLQRKTALVGTLGNGLLSELVESGNTTPDAVLLQSLLADYVAQNVEIVAMEVSSHGLQQGRVRGVNVDVAVLSNLTRDHLDYHQTFAAYASAKRILFEMPGLQYAVLNADDDFGQTLAHDLKTATINIITYGIDNGDIRASNIQFEANCLSFNAETPWGKTSVKANVIGRFNVYNLLAVLASLLVSKVSLNDAATAIAHIQAVAGRMQSLGGGNLPLVVVDYAHTPDALEKVLYTLKTQATSKLICVFGCGGNRDTGKRAEMGKVASNIADAVVITNDNPRNEPPAAIINDIKGGMASNYAIEQDRAKAIAIAILSAKPADIVLIAGKGHEQYQEIGGKKHYFSDVEEANNALAMYEVAA